jgi:hypothetical protein
MAKAKHSFHHQPDSLAGVTIFLMQLANPFSAKDGDLYTHLLADIISYHGCG